MKIGKKSTVTKELTRQERNRRNNLKRITVSAIVAFILFICLLVIESSILNQEEKQSVYQIIKDIPSGTKITEANFDTYLQLKDVQASLIPEDYITEKEVLINKFTNKTYKVRDIITSDGITDTEKLYQDSIENPVEVAFSVDGLSSAVAGLIREGEYINIYGMRKQEGEETEYGYTEGIYEVDQQFTFRHIYIAKAFDSTGKRITSVDEKDADGNVVTATMFNVILNEPDVELFNMMLKNCDIKLVRLMYNTEDDYQTFLNKLNEEAGTVETTTETSKKKDKKSSDEVEPGKAEPIDYTKMAEELKSTLPDITPEQPAENAEQTTEQTTEQTAEQPTNNTEQNAEQPTDNTEQTAEQTAEQPADNTEQTTEQPTENVEQ